MKKWTLKLCAPLASAAVLVGCTQEVDPDPDQNRTAIDHATNRQRQNLIIALTGCLEQGQAANQFMLTQVKPAPLSEQPSDAITSANVTVPDNSSVRLASNEEHDLDRLIGQRVSVEGQITNVGRGPVGTSGDAQPPADRTQSATAEPANAPRVPAEITVRQVETTGERCQSGRSGK